MKKTLEILKILVVILVVILLSIIAFGGIFTKKQGIWNNILPEYKYGMDIEGARELRYALSTDENEKNVYVDADGNVMGEVWKDGQSITDDENVETDANEEIPYAIEKRIIKDNEDSKLTKENFELSKQIIQKRLKAQKIEEYNIRIDDITGKLEIDTTNSEGNVECVEELVSQNGKFQMIDYQNGIVLMDNSDIKKVSVVSSNNSGYNTYLQITFNNQGKEKLKEISKKYVEKEIQNSNTENSEENDAEAEEETEKEYISVVFDDTTMMTTYFGEEINDGILTINVGNSTTDYTEFQKYYNSAKTIADILNSGILPITYELENDNFVKSNITDQVLTNIGIAIAVGVIVISIVLIVKFGKKGLLVSIVSIGYIAILSILIRYTNVKLNINGIMMLILNIILNYVFVGMLLNKIIKNDDFSTKYKQVLKEFNLSVLPIYICATIFTLSKYAIISSMGMVAFWGIILILVYNFIFVKILLNKGDVE